MIQLCQSTTTKHWTVHENNNKYLNLTDPIKLKHLFSKATLSATQGMVVSDAPRNSTQVPIFPTSNDGLLLQKL